MDESLSALLRRIEEKIDGLREDLGQHGQRMAVVETRLGELDRRVTKVESEPSNGRGLLGGAVGGGAIGAALELFQWLRGGGT